jgi:FkbH-like protein
VKSFDDRARSGGAIRSLLTERRFEDAWRLVRASLLVEDDPTIWSLGQSVLRAGAREGWSPPSRREARLAVLSTYESAELVDRLELALCALGVHAQLYAAPYGQVEQEVLGAETELARFEPTHVLIAPTTADLAFRPAEDDRIAELEAEERRWLALWDGVARTTGARVVQHAFVVPDETSLGHLALRMPQSRLALVRELNARLGAAAGANVLLVDCERLAARIGKRSWLDPRLWQVARQPYGYEALGLLARETAAVLAGDLGLAARCLVVDLDNTLWGGLVGEEGPRGVVVGEGPEGEAYAAFQEYLRALKERGVLLAVASKNDAQAAREVFELNPRMRLRLADFAAFVADWRPKSEQVAEIADTLGLGLDALVFADDNAAECAEVEARLGSVDTIHLGDSPFEFVRILGSSVRFEVPAVTADDLARQRSYAGRAEADGLRAQAATLEDFLRSLEMRARVRPLELDLLDRAAQLTQKTNQFNLTLVRRSRAEVEALAADPRAICLTLELEDRFAAHGVVGLAFALPAADDSLTAVIDTLLLSCRVIGRTAESHLLSHVSREALAAGFTKLRGRYVGGPRNALVADLYTRLGFAPVDGDGSLWEYDLGRGPIESVYIVDTDD